MPTSDLAMYHKTPGTVAEIFKHGVHMGAANGTQTIVETVAQPVGQRMADKAEGGASRSVVTSATTTVQETPTSPKGSDAHFGQFGA